MIAIKQKLDLMQAMEKGHEALKTFYLLLIVGEPINKFKKTDNFFFI
jgi:hypothetical protein